MGALNCKVFRGSRDSTENINGTGEFFCFLKQNFNKLFETFIEKFDFFMQIIVTHISSVINFH
jgi:hypothetical protein